MLFGDTDFDKIDWSIIVILFNIVSVYIQNEYEKNYTIYIFNCSDRL